jgi:hypothetical protein
MRAIWYCPAGCRSGSTSSRIEVMRQCLRGGFRALVLDSFTISGDCRPLAAFDCITPANLDRFPADIFEADESIVWYLAIEINEGAAAFYFFLCAGSDRLYAARSNMGRLLLCAS